MSGWLRANLGNDLVLLSSTGDDTDTAGVLFTSSLKRRVAMFGWLVGRLWCVGLHPPLDLSPSAMGVFMKLREHNVWLT